MAGTQDPAILLNISEMIDLAIGTPECGVVDFNMLQTVLHCLAQQLRILGKNVELRGSMANLPTGRDNQQTIRVDEYEYEVDAAKTTDKDKPVMKIGGTATVKPDAEPDTILIVERFKKAEPTGARQSPTRQVESGRAGGPPGGPSGADAAAADADAGTLGAPSGTEQVTGRKTTVRTTIAPAPQSSADRLTLVTLSKFNLLENAVEDLKNRVYGSMPKNDQILEEVRSQTNMKAITDMWTSLNVSSRLEAAEEGIAKLSSLVQDLITETTSLQGSLTRIPDTADAEISATQADLAGGQDGTDAAGHPSSAARPSAAAKPSSASRPSSANEMSTLKKSLNKMKTDLDALSKAFNKAMEELTGEPYAVPSTTTTTDSGGRRSTMMSADVLGRINELEKKINKCCESITKNEGVIQDQINSFQDQLEAIMKQVGTVTNDLSTGKLSPDLIKDLQGLMELFSTVQEMQAQLKQVHETALELAAEKENRQHNIDALLEQIELLKTVKLDREDMVEAMADKADLRMLARKVSHDQFELACDDLSRGLEHALGKLNLQEALWQQALDDIQREIETKLDKMELSPVKDFFNSKLRQLQENLKQMASLRRDVEAAGTKRKLLRDVKCISCDGKAVMPTEAASSVPVSRPLPANFSMKPYLSYELDAIRKSQQTNMPQRNMHDWEAIDKQMGSKQPPKAKSEGDKHLCNRYCGGSHTVTTAAQRVARLGHFVKQWGPDVLPLSSGLAAGDDGRLYKVTTTEAANVGPGGAVDPTTCTPKLPPKEDKPRTPPKQLVISNECRCLEPQGAK